MNQNRKSFLRRALTDQRGQVLPIVAVMMVALLGMAAIVVDLGDVFYSYRELQASTDAAALAGAQSLPASTATTVATDYSSVSGGKNVYGNLSTVTMVAGYPLLKCLTTLTAEGMACVAPAAANAIQVKQQVSVPLYFARLFGTSSVTLIATATASMRGSSTTPYNVAIIVDTTESMNDTDSDSQCNTTRIACALAGVQVLLQDLSPCASSESTCGSATNGNVANSVDRVSLFTFPSMTTTTASDDYDCSSSTSPTIEPYTFPSTTATSLTTMPYTTTTTTGSGRNRQTTTTTLQMTYQVTPFSSDYRTSDTANSLNTSSDLTLSVGGKSGCTGMSAPGGEGTYYAAVIYQAQAALVAEQAANPGSQNVMILLSDGDATSSSSQMVTSTSTSTTVATNSGTYPSYVDECGQAVTAAQYATAQGTRVYAVAYGAESSGCTTDTTGFSKGYTPCQTMENIASAAQYFFSDYTQSGGAGTCVSAAQPTSNLNQIFTQIAGDFTVARLIPDGTT